MFLVFGNCEKQKLRCVKQYAEDANKAAAQNAVHRSHLLRSHQDVASASAALLEGARQDYSKPEPMKDVLQCIECAIAGL